MDRLKKHESDREKGTIPKRFIPVISEIVSCISKGDYGKLESEGQNGRISAADLKRTVQEYGCRILPLPENAFDRAEIYHVESANRIAVFLPLWTQEEGRSDLTLSLSCDLTGHDPRVVIDDLRVL